MIEPAETEQERDLRQFKEEYALGKKHIATSTAILNRIFERGEWKKDGMPWGKWAEEKAGVDKSHAYAMVRVKNPATEALKEYYQTQSVSSTSGTLATSNHNGLRGAVKSQPESTQSPGQALSPDNQEPRQTLRPEAPQPPAENGKAKHMLAGWNRVEDGFGALLREVDSMNHLAPSGLHGKLISEIKACMQTWNTWREKVKNG